MSRNRNETTEAGDMFQPNTVLPEQFFSPHPGRAQVEGEKRLLAAVLVDAVECYMKQMWTADRRGRQLYEDARSWIFDEEQRGFLSFNSVCDILGLDPAYIRRGLDAWRRRQKGHGGGSGSPRREGSGFEDSEGGLRAAS